ncbi:hypothetical protein BD769DRAFT_1626626 [Suillus cothurnatus]|nr:hypothetical protein BD769DRAFT_1626626 [Suillus cothurnatus]
MNNDQPCHSQPESSVFPYNMKIEFEDEDNVDAEVIAWVHPSPPHLRVKKSTIVDNKQFKEVLSAGAHHSSTYIFDVFLHALHLMRIPLSALLFLWMLASVMMCLLDALCTVFVPICYLPLVSRLASSTFEQLLDGSVGGSILSLEIHKAEFATADLTTLVQNSDLESNEILSDLLTTFVKNAKKTVRGLTKLSLRVGGTVDNIMAVNRYAMCTIQDMEKNVLMPYLLTILMLFRTGPSTQDMIVGAFAAENSLHNLNILEEDLSAVHEAVICKDISITAQKSELLGALWTKVGGNQCALMDYERCLSLLKDLGNYQRYAHAHVVAVLQTLHSMSGDMEDLCQRVAAPELASDRRIPLHVHIKSIQNGLQRLQEGQVRTREMEEDVMARVLGLDAD